MLETWKGIESDTIGSVVDSILVLNSKMGVHDCQGGGTQGAAKSTMTNVELGWRRQNKEEARAL